MEQPPDDPRAKQRLEPDVGMSESDMAKFKKLGRNPRTYSEAPDHKQ